MNQKEQSLRQEYEDLQKKLQDPTIFSSKEYPKLAKRQNELRDIITVYNIRGRALVSIKDSKKLIESEKDEEMLDLVRSVLKESEESLANAESKLQELLTAKDPNDEKDVIMEIRAAAGGDEASLFVGDL